MTPFWSHEMSTLTGKNIWSHSILVTWDEHFFWGKKSKNFLQYQTIIFLKLKFHKCKVLNLTWSLCYSIIVNVYLCHIEIDLSRICVGIPAWVYRGTAAYIQEGWNWWESRRGEHTNYGGFILSFEEKNFGSREESEVSGVFVFSHIRMMFFLG